MTQSRTQTKRGTEEANETMAGALERAKPYLTEAVKWSKELQAKAATTSKHEERRSAKGIPEVVWFPLENPFNASDKTKVMSLLRGWAKGTMADFGHVYACIEEDYDLDPAYIFFGQPIRTLSSRRQQLLLKLGTAFAARNL
jgi:hypothetical protein